MGTDVFALLTRWEPMVAAFQEAGGLGFYWDANVRRNDEFEAARLAGKPVRYEDLPGLLPYATTRNFHVGSTFIEAHSYYDHLRDHLPPAIREPADAFIHMLYPQDQERVDDLSADAGMPPDYDVIYAMRPATVRTALARAAAVPWTSMEEIGERTVIPERARSRVPDHSTFADSVLYQQREWMREAAAAGHGLVVVLSV